MSSAAPRHANASRVTSLRNRPVCGVSGAVAVPLRNPAGEEEQIRRALALAGGNKSQAAKLLGIDRKTLYNKLHLYGIE